MALKLSTTVRNAMLDAIEADLLTGGVPVMRIWSGTVPANCAAANALDGAILASPTIGAGDPFAPASNGSKVKSGTWEDTAADASGTATHFRMYRFGGTVCVMQGTVTATGLGGDLTVDNTNFAANQAFTITAFTLNAGNG